MKCGVVYLAVECVQHGVACAIGDTATTACLATFAELVRLTTEGALKDLSVGSSTEWHADVFKLHEKESVVDRQRE